MCEFPVREAVTQRYSVRTFEKRTVEWKLREKILSYAESIKNPLGPKIRLQFIEKTSAPNGEKLGTYGIIKGADLYLGVTVPKEEYALEALGYEFEQVVLYVTALGLGTCWLGGTFNRSAFAAVMDIKENEIFPILSPVGYPTQKKSFTDRIMRRSIKADRRLPWQVLFFKNDFTEPLGEEEAGSYRYPLEMLRLAPSAVNKQPWRVVRDERGFHFYEKHSPGSESTGVDIHRIDVGIGICHFHLAAAEAGLHGCFERKKPDLAVPADMSYVISWIMKDN